MERPRVDSRAGPVIVDELDAAGNYLERTSFCAWGVYVVVSVPNETRKKDGETGWVTSARGAVATSMGAGAHGIVAPARNLEPCYVGSRLWRR